MMFSDAYLKQILVVIIYMMFLPSYLTSNIKFPIKFPR